MHAIWEHRRTDDSGTLGLMRAHGSSSQLIGRADFLRHQIAIDALPQDVCAALATWAGLAGWRPPIRACKKTSTQARKFGFDKPSATTRATIRNGRGNAALDHHSRIGPRAVLHAWRVESGERHVRDLQFDRSELMHRLNAFVEGRNAGPHWTE
jgi:hypothetical protein